MLALSLSAFGEMVFPVVLQHRSNSVEKTSILIFVIEDEVLLQHVLEDTLVEAGFTVAQAFNSDQAMKMLDAQGAQFRALITDVNLGTKITGWDVARHAREIDPDLPVIYTTTANAHDWKSMGVPNSILLTKPYATSQILTAVSQLINAVQMKETGG
jgi:DNA-binding response OmpR family regulator